MSESLQLASALINVAEVDTKPMGPHHHDHQDQQGHSKNGLCQVVGGNDLITSRDGMLA